MQIFKVNLRWMFFLLVWLAPAGLPIQLRSVAQVARPPASNRVSTFQVLHRTALSGGGPVTSLAFDSVSRRLYAARPSEITVLDIDSGHTIGQISYTGEVVALVVIPELSRGFASTADNTLVVFDLTSLRKIATLSIPGKSPDNLAYDSSTRRVFVMNNRSQSVVAVSTDHPSVLGTISLVDDPEAAVADASGHLYIVLSDPAELAVIDTSRMTLLQRVQLSPCVEPRGVSMDVHARRLFVGCSNGLLAVADPDSGRLAARLSIESNSANVAFDPTSHFIYLADPAGMISIVSQRFPDRYRLASSLRTGRPIAAMAVDPAHHHLLVAVARKARPDPQDARHPANLILTIGRSENVAEPNP